ncbi:hypothetical protein PENTCL1PPCAC_5276, partial [Pristionchus entomophagus]
QPRYFEYTSWNDTLTYYKSKSEKSVGSRGSVTLKSARIDLADDFDKCEFTVRVNEDIVWYLMADTEMFRARWYRILTAYSDPDHSSMEHSRSSSAASSTCGDQKLQSPSVYGWREALISARLLDLGAYRDLCATQMAAIQGDLEEFCSSFDVPIARDKLLALNATHTAMMSTVDRIVQLTAEEMAQLHQKPDVLASVKREEGEAHFSSHSTLDAEAALSLANSYAVANEGDDMWHDAEEEVDDREEMREERGDEYEIPSHAHKISCHSPTQQSADEATEKDNQPMANDRHLPFGCFDRVVFSPDHSLAVEVHNLTESQLDYALTGVLDPTMWTLFASEGEMKMYKR